jgi:hypothetical protein
MSYDSRGRAGDFPTVGQLADEHAVRTLVTPVRKAFGVIGQRGVSRPSEVQIRVWLPHALTR